MPSALNLALVAALAAGAVLAATAIGDSGDRDRDRRAVAPRPAPVLIAPTRAQAIEAAAALRDRANDDLARRLSVPADRLLAAERAIVARQLAEAVDRRVLSPEQRDALLACVDAPKTCDRGALPVLHGGLPPGAVPLPGSFPEPALVLAEPVPHPGPRARSCRPLPRRDAGRRRPVRCAVRPLPGPAEALAGELSLPQAKVGAALRGTLRALAGDLQAPGGPAADPDGVPLGMPLQLFPFPAGVAPHGVALWDVRPVPRPARPAPGRP